MRIFGAGPFSSVSHSMGVASSSPSVSRPVMSATTVGGSAAGSWILRPRLAIAPSSASSRKMRFSSTRSAFFRPNSRAISRVPILPGFARMKATMASRPGKPLSCFLFTYPRALPALFFAGVLGAVEGFADVLAAVATGARALLTASDFGFAAAFFAAAFLAGFGASGSAALAAVFFGAAFFFAPRFGFPPPLAGPPSVSAVAPASVVGSGGLFLRPALRLAAALGGALVDQRDGLGERDRLGRLVARDRGVDPAGRNVGAIAAVLDGDAAKARMLAERLTRVGAEAAAARAF